MKVIFKNCPITIAFFFLYIGRCAATGCDYHFMSLAEKTSPFGSAVIIFFIMIKVVENFFACLSYSWYP